MKVGCQTCQAVFDVPSDIKRMYCPTCGVAKPIAEFRLIEGTPAGPYDVPAWMTVGVVVFALILVLIWGAAEIRTNPESTPPRAVVPTSAYVPAAGRINPGVSLYYSPKKMYVGDVVGIEQRYQFPDGTIGRAVQLKMAGGSLEWKRRDAIIHGEWFVRR